MTHPPTEQARIAAYAAARGKMIEERLNRSTRPTEGRESGEFFRLMMEPIPMPPEAQEIIDRNFWDLT